MLNTHMQYAMPYKARSVLDHSNTGIVSSNPARGFLLCCAVLYM